MEKIKEIENTLCSRKAKGYYLIYAPDGTYYLYIENGYLLDSTKDEKPSKVYKKVSKGDNRLKTDVFDGVYTIDDLNAKYSPITQILIKAFEKMDITNENKVDYINKLCKTLKEAEESAETNKNNIELMDEAVRREITQKGLFYDKSESENANEKSRKIINLQSPELTENEEIISEKVKKAIEKDGIEYINQILDKIHIGEHKNIFRKMLMALCVMRGDASFLSETVAEAESGKSFEDTIVFEYMIPNEYIFEVNDMTWSAFSRYSLYGEDFFDRKIIYFGDLGSKKSFMKIEDVFDIVKVLITENRYSRSVSEATEDGYEPEELRLRVDSIGAVYSTVRNSFTGGDTQLESRTLQSTPKPIDVDTVLQQNFYLNTPFSFQYKEREEAINELEELGVFLKSLVGKDIEILNPYEEIFIGFAKGSESPIRELNQQLQLFNAYCLMTLGDCEIINGQYVASIHQIDEYMNEINLENALTPYEFDFLEMLMAKGKTHELLFGSEINITQKIREIETNDNLTEAEKKDEARKIREQFGNIQIITMTEAENNAIESLYNREVDIADLSDREVKDIVQRLYLMYGIRGRSEKFKERLFFKISDIGAIYQRQKAYQNIDDISNLLYTLQKKGYIGKYEHKHSRHNLYYLRERCLDLQEEFKPDKPFKEYLTNFLREIGYKLL